MKQRRDIKVRVMVYAILLIVCTLVSSISASATETAYDRTVVLDKDNVLDTVETEFVEETGEKLNIYNIYVIIECDERSRSQKKVEEQAKKYYDFVTGSGSGNNIVIVFSFLDQAKHGFYSVYFEDENIKAQDLRNIIENANHEYKTEQGLIIACVDNISDYLKKLESELYADEIREKRRDEWYNRLYQYFYYFLLIWIIILSLYILKLTDKVMNLQKKESESSVDKKERQSIDNQKEVEELREWQTLAKETYPTIDKRIFALKASKVGMLFSEKYSSISTLEEYSEMLDKYGKLSDAERSYVGINMEEASNTFDHLAREKAERMNESIMKIIELPANSRNYKRFEALRESLDDLPDVVKAKINNRSKSCFYQKWLEARKDYAAEHGRLD